MTSNKFNNVNSLVTRHKLLVTRKQAKLAFTMAEILLSLTIIGVVAAITLPSLTGNINERTWNTQRKALYSRFSQAVALMPALNGYGSTDDNAAETFITSGLSKVLKINNICDKDSVEECGFPGQITNGKTSKVGFPKTAASLYAYNVNAHGGITYPNLEPAAFETANGESVLTFYNKNCKPFDVIENSDENGSYRQVPSKMCANFIYDLNGKKGPNTFGKDIGIITVFYPSDPVVVAPYPHLQGGELEVAWAQATSSCKDFDEEYRAPNREEMMSMMYNNSLIGLSSSSRFWTTTRFDSSRAWLVSLTNNVFPKSVGYAGGGGDATHTVRCVKR